MGLRIQIVLFIFECFMSFWYWVVLNYVIRGLNFDKRFKQENVIMFCSLLNALYLFGIG
jgi:hypothetical protein